VTMRKGQWKLIHNLGVGYAGRWSGVENKAQVELFRIQRQGSEASDLEEAKNLSEKFPGIRDEMLAELNQFLASTGVTMPYRNLRSNLVSDQERASSPKVLELRSEKDRVWIKIEEGEGKVAIEQAHLLYTLNPKEFDQTRGHREEWFKTDARIDQGKIEATMPPGATHAVFCLRDAHGFLITSEPLPDFQAVPYGTQADSTFIKNGFAYKPGLYSLIQLGEDALGEANKQKLSTKQLEKRLSVAKKLYTSPKFDRLALSDTIRSLRAEIRKLEMVPQSKHYTINRFPTDPLF